MRIGMAVVAAIAVGLTAGIASDTGLGQTVPPDAWATAWGDFAPVTVKGRGDKAVSIPTTAGKTVVVTCNTAMTVLVASADSLAGVRQQHTPLGRAGSCASGGRFLLGLTEPFSGKLRVLLTGRWSLRLTPVGDLPELPVKTSGRAPGIYRFGGTAGAISLTVPAQRKNPSAFYTSFDLAQMTGHGSETSILTSPGSTTSTTLTGTLLTGVPSIVFIGWFGSMGQLPRDAPTKTPWSTTLIQG